MLHCNGKDQSSWVGIWVLVTVKQLVLRMRISPTRAFGGWAVIPTWAASLKTSSNDDGPKGCYRSAPPVSLLSVTSSQHISDQCSQTCLSNGDPLKISHGNILEIEIADKATAGFGMSVAHTWVTDVRFVSYAYVSCFLSMRCTLLAKRITQMLSRSGCIPVPLARDCQCPRRQHHTRVDIQKGGIAPTPWQCRESGSHQSTTGSFAWMQTRVGAGG